MPFKEENSFQKQHFSEFYQFKRFLGAGSYGVVVDDADAGNSEVGLEETAAAAEEGRREREEGAGSHGPCFVIRENLC